MLGSLAEDDPARPRRRDGSDLGPIFRREANLAARLEARARAPGLGDFDPRLPGDDVPGQERDVARAPDNDPGRRRLDGFAQSQLDEKGEPFSGPGSVAAQALERDGGGQVFFLGGLQADERAPGRSEGLQAAEADEQKEGRAQDGFDERRSFAPLAPHGWNPSAPER